MAQKTKDKRTASHFISVQALAFLSFPHFINFSYFRISFFLRHSKDRFGWLE